MPPYRFYAVNSDGHITEPPKVADFVGDRAAIAAAKALIADKAIELWAGPRVVIKLGPKRRDG